MNYIGIRGHRGSGKQTVAYLLGQTIDWILSDNFKDTYENDFKRWCNNIIKDEDIINEVSLIKVYFDSFGDSPKTFVSLLLGMDPGTTNNDYYKDHTIINLKDFSYKVYDDIPDDIECLSAEELYKLFNAKKEPATILKDIYVTLREFVMYFGKEVMQRYFGLNVWVKTLRASEEWYQSTYNDKNYYKIYYDIKFPSEVTYIKDKNGVIVKVSRPGSKKKGKDRLLHDDRYDYEVVIGDSLYDLKDTIYEIAEEIIKNNTYGKEN